MKYAFSTGSIRSFISLPCFFFLISFPPSLPNSCSFNLFPLPPFTLGYLLFCFLCPFLILFLLSVSYFSVFCWPTPLLRPLPLFLLSNCLHALLFLLWSNSVVPVLCCFAVILFSSLVVLLSCSSVLSCPLCYLSLVFLLFLLMSCCLSLLPIAVLHPPCPTPAWTVLPLFRPSFFFSSGLQGWGAGQQLQGQGPRQGRKKRNKT